MFYNTGMIEGAGGAPARPEIEGLFEALAAVRRRPLAGVSGDALAEELARLCQARHIFELAIAETTGAYAGTGHAEAATTTTRSATCAKPATWPPGRPWPPSRWAPSCRG